MPEHGLGTKTLRGMFWAYGSFVGANLLSLIATAILARLLVPRDFGLVALALFFIALLDTVSDLGVNQALVVAKKEEELERAETVFVWSIAFGGVLSLVIVALSPVAALFFDEPRLTALLSVLGLRFAIRSFGATHYALAQKRIEFRPRTGAEIADACARGITGILLAIAGFGAWSLVLGYIAGSVAFVLVVWLMVPWRPKLAPKRAHLPQMLRFGGLLTLVDINAALGSNLDYLFIGRVLGATELGLYTIGFRVPSLLIGNVSAVAGRVLFPAFAAVERARVGEAFITSLRYTMMFAVPLAAGLAVLAHPAILAVFGSQWKDSIPVMQVLTIWALGVAVGIPAGTAYKSTGRPQVLLALGVPRALLLGATIAIFVDQGIVAVAACLASVTGLFAVINLGFAARLLKVRAVAILKAAWPSIVATAAMVAALVPLERAIDADWPALVCGALIGSCVYVAFLWLLARESLIQLRDTAFPRKLPGEDPLAPSDGLEAEEGLAETRA
jgi:O-antigen/teichoic acid export membrane protein